MQQQPPADSRDALRRQRRIYRALFATSVVLAAVGAPLLMQGTVVLAQSLSRGLGDASALHGLLVFAASAAPLALAGFAWKRTKGFSDLLDERED